MALGLVVRRVRQEAGITQEQLAHHVQIATAYVPRIEQGRTSLGFDTLVRLCDALAIEPSSLLSSTEALIRAPERLKDEAERFAGERNRRGRPPVVKK